MMRTNIGAAREEGYFGAFDKLFGDYGQIYKQSKEAAGERRARHEFGLNTLFQPSNTPLVCRWLAGLTRMDKAVATPREITPYTKEQILRLEDALFKLPNQLDFEQYTEHFFAPGIYVRQLTIPAGTVLTGKIHRYEIMNILVSGTIKVTTDDGVEEVSGPLIFNSKAGSKKAGFALTDVVWLNVHPTELTDLEEIERHFIAPSFEALEQEQRKQIGPSVDEQEDEQ
jgi:hypothetical protein